MKKLFTQLTLVFALVFGLAGCGNQTTHSKSAANDNQITITYNLKRQHHEFASKKVKVKNGATVLKGLQKTGWKVKLNKGMVTSIDNNTQNEKQKVYWMYKINGQEAQNGVAKQKVHRNDKIDFDLQTVNQ
ncbi:MAG TPA: DUF4430 domain-containing protein [Candidatus Ligilactobacillus excrementigallinarum]|uniref:DUF4430 domain-containing protein n=1 Tax=Candidatus Ligilactobacillus excrementigallinarum TaxID=2838641 RepID=A0A9D1UVQ3_9LACO|nr:DUF4430 domain-containing protein [Candidatus Ligilactobacillus excrementigallinarum]